MADQKPSNRERVKEIVSSIEQNIQDLFQSERYFDYLRTMSRFHSYGTAYKGHGGATGRDGTAVSRKSTALGWNDEQYPLCRRGSGLE